MSDTRQCPRPDPHAAHEWWDGAAVAQCPGLATFQLEDLLSALEELPPPYRMQDHAPHPGEPVVRDGRLVLDCQQLTRHDPHPWNRGELGEDHCVIILYCDGRAEAAPLPPGTATVHDLPRRHPQYEPRPPAEQPAP